MFNGNESREANSVPSSKNRATLLNFACVESTSSIDKLKLAVKSVRVKLLIAITGLTRVLVVVEFDLIDSSTSLEFSFKLFF